MVGGNIDLRGVPDLESGEAFLQLLGADIRQGDQFGLSRSAQRLAGGASAAAAAADQGDFDCVIAGSSEDGALERERAAERSSGGSPDERPTIQL
jgi:hypothetical protein